MKLQQLGEWRLCNTQTNSDLSDFYKSTHPFPRYWATAPTLTDQRFYSKLHQLQPTEGNNWQKLDRYKADYEAKTNEDSSMLRWYRQMLENFSNHEKAGARRLWSALQGSQPTNFKVTETCDAADTFYRKAFFATCQAVLVRATCFSTCTRVTDP